ncbi:MAG: hypothetical protein IJ087_03065 [Eggerthellaceae bacterium]|nr:hypothetical protein [Eggerthellaceae bacterium]
MIIAYEGADITPLVSVSKCVYDAREEGRVPQLVIEFSDGKGVVDSWNPQRGECVSVTGDGAPETGKMFVSSCEPKAGGYIVRADALPIPDTRASRLWRNTTFYVVAAQIASKLGCGISVHGASDMAFAYVRQDDERALPVLARLCAFTGCTFDVYDGTVHLCSRSWAESQDSAGTLEVLARSGYSYRRRQIYTACSIQQPGIHGYRDSFAASSGSAGHTLSISLESSIGFPGSSELQRACSGVLACVNARAEGGNAKIDGLTPYTPGTVCMVECAQSSSVSGPAIITRVRNDYANNKSKAWWRLLQ